MSAPLICVIDDDEAVRDSLGFLLQAKGMAVRSYASAEEFLAGRIDECHCLVTDVRMPGMDGLALFRLLKARSFAAPVILITGHGDIPLAVSVMREGAADFLQKPFGHEEFLGAVRRGLEAAPARSESAEIARTRVATLSQREREVMEGLVLGKANKVIAIELGISPRTVEIYRAHVMTKMEAENFAELVRLALRAGVLRE